jgi:hypothetical protein
MSNIIELSAFQGARSPKRDLHSENDELVDARLIGRRRGAARRMVFRSYNLIVQSDEADLLRDVCFDTDKAQTKLKFIRRQIAADREHAAAREKLLTSAEDKLSAAIVAAQSLTRPPAPLLEPPRRTKSEALAHRREFKAAMRQRIRDVAASRDLSEEEIKPALTLKHHEIGKFTEKHGVNVEWLLEGKGRIFEKDPIAMSPILTGEEFAALVRTMPIADQEIILTMLRQMAKGHRA